MPPRPAAPKGACTAGEAGGDPAQHAEAFFRALRSAFGHTLGTLAPGQRTGAVLAQAWDSFDGNLRLQCEGQPPVACRRGCPSCCTLRVAALAPEVLLVAATVRAIAPALQARGVDLPARLREADAATRGMDESARVRAGQRCPWLIQGVCVIHHVRPLACRGHASHDRRACVDAAAGRVAQVPFSGPHRVVRLLVQAALQAALRERRLAWGAYELNHGVLIALDDEQAHARWLAGGDPLHAAALDTPAAMSAQAAWFDTL